MDFEGRHENTETQPEAFSRDALGRPADAFLDGRDLSQGGRLGCDETYMRLALEQARRAASLGEVPIGAVVVYDPIDPATRRPVNEHPRVIAQACNLRETTNDPAGHAEFLALKQASDELGVWRLSGCTVYVTLEPCVMCAGLMHQSRIDRCVYGAPDAKAGALGSLYEMNADERLNHNYPVEAGVLGEECAELLKDFFKRRRKPRKRPDEQ